MPDPTATIRADFDRIAGLGADEGWSHNSHYQDFLLRQIPSPCGEALEIGCGRGAFTRRLAERAGRVLALDLSPKMIDAARAASTGCNNIDYQVADAITWAFPRERFDTITSIATLHHLPLEPMLARMRDALRPGGALVVLDLYRAVGWRDCAIMASAVPISLALKLLRNRRLREPSEVREAWDAHGQHDLYPTLAEVRAACARQLPGAQVRRHLLWRYSVIWCKGSDSAPLSGAALVR